MIEKAVECLINNTFSEYSDVAPFNKEISKKFIGTGQYFDLGYSKIILKTINLNTWTYQM